MKKISPAEKRIIDAVHAVKAMPIQKIMVPRSQIKAFSYAATLGSVMPAFRQTYHSRYPVYYPDQDHIVGILHIKDIVPFWHEHQGKPVVEFVRLPYFVYEIRPALDVFLELQRRRISIAIVIDELGLLSGLITVEDLIEEIVGDLDDEHDRAAEAMLEIISDREAVLDARLSLKDFNQRWQTSIDDPEVSTVAGLIIKHADRIPRPGEEIQIQNLKFTVLTASRRKINKVSVVKEKF